MPEMNSPPVPLPCPCSLSRQSYRLGLAVLGSRKKENLCLKVDKALGGMLPDLADGRPAADDAVAVVNAKKAARTVVTVLMSAYKFPEVTKGALLIDDTYHCCRALCCLISV